MYQFLLNRNAMLPRLIYHRTVFDDYAEYSNESTVF